MYESSLEPGDVVELTRSYDGLAPGSFVVLHVEAGRASLASVQMRSNGEIESRSSLALLGQHELEMFRRTCVRIPMYAAHGYGFRV